jgi:hypothetical protein
MTKTTRRVHAAETAGTQVENCADERRLAGTLAVLLIRVVLATCWALVPTLQIRIK